jgi:hypothetical protein
MVSVFSAVTDPVKKLNFNQLRRAMMRQPFAIEAGILSKNWTSSFWTFWFDSRIEASETARETVFGIVILCLQGKN